MLVFPTRLFRPQTVLPQLVGGLVSGGVSAGGVSQYADMSGGGFWQIEQRGIVIRNRETYMAFRALSSAARNGATPMIVPVEDRKHQPITPKLSTTPFDDLTLWDDGTAWDQAEVDAVVTVTAPLRATSITCTYTGPKPLVGGELFSFLHGGNKGWRMHSLDELVSGGEGDGGTTVFNFSPPLRASVAVDTPINFDSPRCVCQVVGGLPALYSRLDRTGSADAVFRECFPATL
jgi:hypothetical protein